MKFVSGKKEKGCVFCNRLRSKNDQKHRILYRGKNSFIILNIYPYSNGHMMVVPNTHESRIEKLPTATLCEMMELVKMAVRSLDKAYKPQGYNIGLNLGKSAGAGIARHLHIHIVPRWDGDTGFTCITSDLKIIPESLDNTYRSLKKHIKK